MKAAEMAARMGKFRHGLPQAQLRGMKRGLVWGVKEIASRMEAADRDPMIDPPNAPPGPIKVRSGALRRGLRIIEPTIENGKIVGGIRVVGVDYAAIHEYGGTTGEHVIMPKKATVLAFPGAGGNTVFATIVHHPGSVIPARPYIRPVIPEIQKRCRDDMRTEINKLGKSTIGRMWNGIVG